MEVMITCMEKFFSMTLTQNVAVNVELHKYEFRGYFGQKLAVVGRSKNNVTFDPCKYFNLSS